jgi:hypothetical protein
LHIADEKDRLPAGSGADSEDTRIHRHDPNLNDQRTTRCAELQKPRSKSRSGLFASSRLFLSRLLRGSSLF